MARKDAPRDILRGFLSNPFFRLPGMGLKLFILGVASGFLVALALPEVGTATYAFQLAQAARLNVGYVGGAGLMTVASMIFLRNFSVALLIAVIPLILIKHTLSYRKRRPYKSGDRNLKLRNEIYFVLTFYSVSVLFAYGFSVFGLFLAYVFLKDSFKGLLLWVSYLVPHGILETLGIILSASTSIVIGNSWLRNPRPSTNNLWNGISKKDYVCYLLFLLVIFSSSAILETNVSMRFMQLIARALG